MRLLPCSSSHHTFCSLHCPIKHQYFKFSALVLVVSTPLQAMDPAVGSVGLSAEPQDCCLNPCAQIACAALVNGDIELHSYAVVPGAPGDEESGTSFTSFLQDRFAAHESDADGDDGLSCRAVSFLSSGEQLLAGYSDCCIKVFDLTQGKCVATYDDAHEDEVSRLLSVSDQLFVSGDEAGEISLWDMRSKAKVYSYTVHTDYISDFALHTDGRSLIAVSGDGTLSVHDTVTRKFKHRSESDADDELLSVAVLKRGSKVVCGTQSGVINLYSWGAMNDCSDRFPGHPESVQALVQFDDDTLITGSSDGAIRIISLLPNKLLGVLGAHTADGFPIERLALSADRRVLASTSHDTVLKLWDLTILHDDEEDDDDEEGEESDDEEGEGAVQEVEEPGEEEVGRAIAEVFAARKRKQRDAAAGGSVDLDSEDGDSDFGGEEGGESESEDEDEGPAASGDEDAASGSGDDALAAAPEPSTSKPAQAAGKRATPGKGKTPAGKLEDSGAPAASGDGDGDDGDSSGDDSEDGDGKKRRKNDRREKTKWTKGMEQRKRPASSNFFADLL